MSADLKEYWVTWWKYSKAIIIMTVVLVIGTISFSRVAAIGALVGGITAFLNFRLLAIDVQRSVELIPAAARMFAFTRYLRRVLLAATVLVLLLLHPALGVYAFVSALPPFFAVKITLTVEAFAGHFAGFAKKNKNHERKGV